MLQKCSNIGGLVRVQLVALIYPLGKYHIFERLAGSLVLCKKLLVFSDLSSQLQVHTISRVSLLST